MAKNNSVEDNSAILAVVSEVIQYAERHRFVRDKSPAALASKAARALNKRGFAPPSGQAYWVGTDVQSLLDKVAKG